MTAHRPSLFAGVLAVALCALPARGSDLTPNLQIVHSMTTIDSLPSKAELTALLGGNELTKLSAYALDPNLDFGVRLRAVRALPHFCADQPQQCHDAILAVFDNIAAAHDPTEQKILRLRAAIEALGVARSGLPGDQQILLGYLTHNSRDIRVAAVRALRDLCDPAVIPILIDRRGRDPSKQVQLAIAKAVPVLQLCGP